MLKLLIVEDEINTRRELGNIFDWQRVGFSVCSAVRDGAEALDYLKSNPVDVVLTDIAMPNMSGLELIAQIRELGIPVECVILSGYNNFEFAQTAIRYHVSNYLLKPIQEDELYSLFSSLRDRIASARLKQESDAQAKHLLELSQTELVEKALENYLHGLSWQEDAIMFLLVHFSCVQPGDHLALALWEGDDREWAQQKHRLQAWYLNTLKRTCITFRHGDISVLLLASPPGTPLVSTLSDGCAELHLRSLLSAQTAVVADLAELFHELLSHMGRLFYLEFGRIESIAQTGSINCPMPDTDEYAQLFAAAIRKQSETDFTLALRRLSSAMTEAAPARELAAITLTELCRMVADTLEQETDTLPFSFNDVFLRLESCPSSASQQQQAKSILRSLYDGFVAQEKSTLVADRIKTYIDAHFSEPLSLSELAGRFYFSPNYLSALFQQQIGMPLPRYIKKVRLKQAQQLLAETDRYVREIASDTGYSNYRTFCQSFKEEYHMTPMQYRILCHVRRFK